MLSALASSVILPLAISHHTTFLRRQLQMQPTTLRHFCYSTQYFSYCHIVWCWKPGTNRQLHNYCIQCQLNLPQKYLLLRLWAAISFRCIDTVFLVIVNIQFLLLLFRRQISWILQNCT